MKKKVSDSELFNRQVNYILIEKLWKYKNPKKSAEDFYSFIHISKNTYTRIRHADTYNCVNLERCWNDRDSVISRMGLAKNVMTGIEMIHIDNVTEADWKQYISYRYIDKEKSDKRTDYIQWFNRELKKEFAKLVPDRKDNRDISKLCYFYTYGKSTNENEVDREMMDLKNSLEGIGIKEIKNCDKGLREEIYTIMKAKCAELQIIIEYEKLE